MYEEQLQRLKHAPGSLWRLQMTVWRGQDNVKVKENFFKPVVHLDLKFPTRR